MSSGQDGNAATCEIAYLWGTANRKGSRKKDIASSHHPPAIQIRKQPVEPVDRRPLPDRQKITQSYPLQHGSTAHLHYDQPTFIPDQSASAKRKTYSQLTLSLTCPILRRTPFRWRGEAWLRRLAPGMDFSLGRRRDLPRMHPIQLMSCPGVLTDRLYNSDSFCV